MSLDTIRDAVEEATGVRPEGPAQPMGGGCINDAFRLGDFFVKTNELSKEAMFEVESLGLTALHQSNSVRVPQPICSGCDSALAFVVLEFLPLGGGSTSSQETLGRQLADLHRTTADHFGWEQDNFIGATPQPNLQSERWIDFLREHRLGHILHLAEGCGYAFRNAAGLLDNLDRFFESEPPPSLLHGDLWGGNAGALKDGTPDIFDPAVYHGDREADLAMTRLFGGFSPAFYAAYAEAWPLAPGHEARSDLYNLYHILNHAVLFGGGYARQAQGMMDELLRRI